MTEIKNSTESTFSADISEKSTALVYFWASWCTPCKVMTPTFEEFAKEAGDVQLLKIDVDANQVIAQQFNVMSVPTLLLFKNGQVVAQNVGSLPLQQLKEFAKK